jgi:hypothetical protein
VTSDQRAAEGDGLGNRWRLGVALGVTSFLRDEPVEGGVAHGLERCAFPHRPGLPEGVQVGVEVVEGLGDPGVFALHHDGRIPGLRRISLVDVNDLDLVQSLINHVDGAGLVPIAKTSFTPSLSV